MKLTRLENIELCKIINNTLPDGERTETYETTPYQAIIEYLYKDEIAVTMYGADVDKTLRICTIKNQLEKLLLTKVNNKSDNISKYLINYNDKKYAILKVTPRYIDIRWR